MPLLRRYDYYPYAPYGYYLTRPTKRLSPKLDGLPKGHEVVITYGKGGGKSIKMKDGLLEGWHVGGGKKSEVWGKT